VSHVLELFTNLKIKNKRHEENFGVELYGRTPGSQINPSSNGQLMIFFGCGVLLGAHFVAALAKSSMMSEEECYEALNGRMHCLINYPNNDDWRSKSLNPMMQTYREVEEFFVKFPSYFWPKNEIVLSLAT